MNFKLNIDNNICKIILLFLLFSCKDASRHDSNDEKVDSLINVTLFNNDVTFSNVETVRSLKTTLIKEIQAEGYIIADERRNIHVPVRFGGRIEKLYVKYMYQYISEGSPILEIFSPEINTVIEEYLMLINTGASAELQNSSRQKLLLLGMSQFQIHSIERDIVTPSSIKILSPKSGYVYFGDSQFNRNKMKEDKMKMELNGMNMNALIGTAKKGRNTTGNIALSEGAYVKKDQMLFIVNDFLEVWGIVLFREIEGALINKDDKIVLWSEQILDSIPAKVDFIEPEYINGQNFYSARIYLKNPKNNIQINSLINAFLKVEIPDVILVPKTSVYDLGLRKIVFEKVISLSDTKVFKAKEVITGHQNEKFIEIVNGLKENSLIAKDAGYLIDSEYFVE